MFLKYFKLNIFLLVTIFSFHSHAMLCRPVARQRTVRPVPISRSISSHTTSVAVQALRERHQRRIEIEQRYALQQVIYGEAARIGWAGMLARGTILSGGSLIDGSPLMVGMLTASEPLTRGFLEHNEKESELKLILGELIKVIAIQSEKKNKNV